VNPAAEIVGRAGRAVTAAQAGDLGQFSKASTELAVLDAERVGIVQAAVIRALLEELHPTGLTGEHIRDALERCLRASAGWYPELDVDLLVAIYTGALGMSDPDAAAPASTEATMSSHASIVIADLLTAAGTGSSRYLDAAIAELERGETIELP
jgi:hypothetical protein